MNPDCTDPTAASGEPSRARPPETHDLDAALRRSWTTTRLLRAFACVGLALLACAAPEGQFVGPTPQELKDRPIRVVTTTGMIADLAENIGGDRVRVTALMGPGIDPHLYRAREGDIGRIAQSDVVFYNGLHLEARLSEVLERLGRHRRTAAVTARFDERVLLPVPGSRDLHDPHVWFDVRLWMEAAREVGRVLAVMDTAHAPLYESRMRIYLDELERLDVYVRAQAARVPAEKRVLITAHDAFHYFGRAYGFDVRGLQGISTASEAGTADVQRLAEFAAARRIPAMFVESSVSPRSIQAVQAAVRARGFEVGLGGSLYSDAMGTPGTPEGSYPGMVRHNIDTIVAALLR